VSYRALPRALSAVALRAPAPAALPRAQLALLDGGSGGGVAASSAAFLAAEWSEADAVALVGSGGASLAAGAPPADASALLPVLPLGTAEDVALTLDLFALLPGRAAASSAPAAVRAVALAPGVFFLSRGSLGHAAEGAPAGGTATGAPAPDASGSATTVDSPGGVLLSATTVTWTLTGAPAAGIFNGSSARAAAAAGAPIAPAPHSVTMTVRGAAGGARIAAGALRPG
jgi:hypothetical protein